jgi:hypothetical protein
VLNRTICRKCKFGERSREYKALPIDVRRAWRQAFYNDWRRSGLVSCPAATSDLGVGVTKDLPPEWCPFALEHIMQENKDG